MPISGRRFSRFLTFAFLGLASICGAVTYHVDPGGADTADGLKPASAWKSLTRANTATFKPGDSLLFLRGARFSGKLIPKGSGTESKPIAIGAYGSGSRPILDGAGSTGQGVIHLDRLSWIGVSGLEITNDAPAAGDRRGALVSGPSRGIALTDLLVRDIKGSPGQELADKATGGIAFTGDGSDITVEGCEIRGVDDIGLTTNGGSYTRFAARDNVIHDIAKNAIIFRGGDSSCVLERNVCFRTCARVEDGNTIFSVDCRGTRFQFNEGFENLSSTGRDGSLYDADINGAIGTVWQYSYSHDNAEGLMWFCTNAQDTGIQVRYNISRGDLGKIFCFSFPLGHAAIYNNTVSIPVDAKGWVIYEKQNKYGYGFHNNIIANASAATGYVFANADRAFDYNLFSGKHPAGQPADAHKLETDPLFADPAGGGLGIASLDGFKLKAGSPALNSGRAMPTPGARDFFGNPLYHQAPDRGAFEAPAPGSLRPFGGLPGGRTSRPRVDRFRKPGGSARDAMGRQASIDPGSQADADAARLAGDPAFLAELRALHALGLMADTSITGLRAAWARENHARQSALSAGAMVIGPAAWSLSAYVAWSVASLRPHALARLAAQGAEPAESLLLAEYARLRASRFAEPYAILELNFAAGGRDTLDLPLMPRDSEGEDPQGLVEAARKLAPGGALPLKAARGAARHRAPATVVHCLAKGTRLLPYPDVRPLLRRELLLAAYANAVVRATPERCAPGRVMLSFRP